MELKDLKEGDKVVVYKRWGDSINVIEKVTKTQIVVNGTKYRRESGSQIGGSVWYSSRIGICTKEEENRIRSQISVNRMKRFIKEYDIDSLSYKKLEKIYNILKNKDENG